MDHNIRKYKEYLDSITDDEFLKMIRKCSGHNPGMSERYFLLHEITGQVQSIKGMEYALEVFQEEIDKVKAQLKVSQEKLKQSFNCR